MRMPRRPTPLGSAYTALSATTAAAQLLAGQTAFPALVALVVVTALALRGRTDRWTTVLILLHLAIAATGPRPDTVVDWTAWCAIATGLAGLHLLAAWLPWRQEHPTPEKAVTALLGRRLFAGVAASTGTTVLVAVSFATGPT